MRTDCANVSSRNARRIRRVKPDGWRNRSRNLFRFTLREEFFCRAIDRIASAKITKRKDLDEPRRLKLPMKGNDAQPRVPALKDLYGPKRSSFPWEEQQTEIVRFWADSGDCWGFLFHHLSGSYYSAKEQRLLIDWPLGTIVVTGPKALEFYEQFSNHRATLLRGRRQRYSIGQDASKLREASRGGRQNGCARNWRR
jgi:hypothetical protein